MNHIIQSLANTPRDSLTVTGQISLKDIEELQAQGYTISTSLTNRSFTVYKPKKK
jgi:hypothetical protein